MIRLLFLLKFFNTLFTTYRGLGLETVFMNILKVYCDPGNLVLVLGTNDYEETYFIEKLKNNGVNHLPRIITAHCLSEERFTFKIYY
jgi:DNA excision repair protein ERCC-4